MSHPVCGSSDSEGYGDTSCARDRRASNVRGYASAKAKVKDEKERRNDKSWTKGREKKDRITEETKREVWGKTDILWEQAGTVWEQADKVRSYDPTLWRRDRYKNVVFWHFTRTGGGYGVFQYAIDHILALKNGGKTELKNLQILHAGINNKKSDNDKFSEEEGIRFSYHIQRFVTSQLMDWVQMACTGTVTRDGETLLIAMSLREMEIYPDMKMKTGLGDQLNEEEKVLLVRMKNKVLPIDVDYFSLILPKIPSVVVNDRLSYDDLKRQLEQLQLKVKEVANMCSKDGNLDATQILELSNLVDKQIEEAS
ncbi:hypothetical protein OROGR_031961 [Orobanche gracilis]